MSEHVHTRTDTPSSIHILIISKSLNLHFRLLTPPDTTSKLTAGPSDLDLSISLVLFDTTSRQRQTLPFIINFISGFLD